MLQASIVQWLIKSGFVTSRHVVQGSLHISNPANPAHSARPQCSYRYHILPLSSLYILHHFPPAKQLSRITRPFASPVFPSFVPFLLSSLYAPPSLQLCRDTRPYISPAFTIYPVHIFLKLALQFCILQDEGHLVACGCFCQVRYRSYVTLKPTPVTAWKSQLENFRKHRRVSFGDENEHRLLSGARNPF